MCDAGGDVDDSETIYAFDKVTKIAFRMMEMRVKQGEPPLVAGNHILDLPMWKDDHDT